VAGRGSGPALGLVRWELCHVLIFSFFFIKEKGQELYNIERLNETNPNEDFLKTKIQHLLGIKFLSSLYLCAEVNGHFYTFLPRVSLR
jgi:hypothetical protein